MLFLSSFRHDRRQHLLPRRNALLATIHWKRPSLWAISRRHATSDRWVIQFGSYESTDGCHSSYAVNRFQNECKPWKTASKTLRKTFMEWHTNSWHSPSSHRISNIAMTVDWLIGLCVLIYLLFLCTSQVSLPAGFLSWIKYCNTKVGRF